MLRAIPQTAIPLTLAAAGISIVMLAGPDAPAQAQELKFKGHPVIRLTFEDGGGDDLATAGLGADGLSGTPPEVSDPSNAAQLRRLAIYNNYRALVDTSDGGGYGVFFGPGVPLEAGMAEPDELIFGDEFLAFGDTRRTENVTMMVQVPDSFDDGQPCIVTGPSSGSRGVYGAIGTSGEWGLKRGCAVAYTDKGTGTGFHDLQDDTVNLIRGEREDADVAGGRSNFTAPIGPGQQARFNAETPNRFAAKHAHSEDNPEAFWGDHVLDSIEFAFFVLNEVIRPERFPQSPAFTSDNTIVIGSSVSNGGGASVRAVERDVRGLIDGVAVSEPNVNPTFDDRFVIRQGDRDPVVEHSRSLYEYYSVYFLYQACANRAPENLSAPLNFTPPAIGEAACASLAEKGLIEGDTVDQQATNAQAVINSFGILPEQNVVQPVQWLSFVPQAIAATYANAYSRSDVVDNLCGFSFAAVDEDGNPVPLADGDEAVLFATSNGIPPTGEVNLINNRSLASDGTLEAKQIRAATSPSTGRMDESIDAALCVRGLFLGEDPVTGERLRGRDQATHRHLLRGIEEIRSDGDFDGVPILIATGRADGVLPPNHTSRALFGLNQLVEGPSSGLRYYEVLNAQHLDILNGLAGFDTRFIPLHFYFFEVLNLLWAHLTEDAALPPSQVVRTTPRGGTPGSAPALDSSNLPPIAQVPDAGDLIEFTGDAVIIPE